MNGSSRSCAALFFGACALLFAQTPAGAQTRIAGFEWRFQVFDYNLNTHDFVVNQRFSARRGTVDLQADRAKGNDKTRTFTATGNVVVHQHGAPGSKGSTGQAPSTLTSDTLRVNGVTQTYAASGNVHFTQPDRDVTADAGALNELTGALHLEGNVKIRDGALFLEASVVDYNTKSGEFATPQRFRATREGTQIEADKGEGNSRTQLFTGTGNVVVNQTQPLRNRGDISKLTEQPSTLTTDKLEANGLLKTYVATGNVHFTQADRDAKSEHGSLDDLNHQLHLDGHVKIKDGDRYLDGDRVDYNTATGDVHAEGNVLVRAPVQSFAGPSLAPVPSTPKKGRK